MVLVSDKLSNDIGILQTKLSNQEGHEARRIGLEAMPLDQYIEGGYGECQTGFEIRPDPMHHLLEGEQGDAGGYAAIGISSTSRSMSGYQRLKMAPSSPLSVRTRVCNNKCAPSLDHCIVG
jgi:hypothetical protein